MNLSGLYDCAEQAKIKVDCFDLKQEKCITIYDDENYYIGINPFALTSTADEAVCLGHELGHCITGSVYNRYTHPVIRSRCERTAKIWEIKKLIPKDELIEAYKNGIADNYELADYFGVTEDFLQEAIKYYSEG